MKSTCRPTTWSCCLPATLGKGPAVDCKICIRRAYSSSSSQLSIWKPMLFIYIKSFFLACILSPPRRSQRKILWSLSRNSTLPWRRYAPSTGNDSGTVIWTLNGAATAIDCSSATARAGTGALATSAVGCSSTAGCVGTGSLAGSAADCASTAKSNCKLDCAQQATNHLYMSPQIIANSLNMTWWWLKVRSSCDEVGWDVSGRSWIKGCNI